MHIHNATLPFTGTAFQTGGNTVDGTSDPTGTSAGSGTSSASGPTPDASGGTSGTSSASLVSSGDVPADTDAAAARIEAAVQQILAAGSTSLDSLDLLARVMIQQNGLQRHAALEDRMAARQTAMTDLLSQADSMTKEAKQMLTGAIVSLVVGAVSAGLSLAGSVGGAIKSVKGAGKEVENATKLGGLTKDFQSAVKEAKFVKAFNAKTEMNELKTVMAKEQKVMKILEGIEQGSKFGESAAKGVDGSVGSQNKILEAQQKTDEAQSQNQGSVEDQMKTTQQALTDMCSQILSFLHDMQEAKAEGMAAFTRA